MTISRREFMDAVNRWTDDVRRRALEMFDRGTDPGAAIRIAVEAAIAAEKIRLKASIGAALATMGKPPKGN